MLYIGYKCGILNIDRNGGIVMLERIKRSWKYSDKDDKIVFFTLFLLVTFLVVILSYAVYSYFYPKTLDYKDRPAMVKSVSFYNSSSVIPINVGNNITVYQPISESGSTVTYEDENGKRFYEDFSGGTMLVEGDKVIISVGYDDGEETEYVKFVKRLE